MKRTMLIILACLLAFAVLGCASEPTVTKQELNNVKNELLTQIDDLTQQNKLLQQEIEKLTKSQAFTGEYSQLFNYALIGDKYCALSVKEDVEVPEILVVPNRYQDTEVAYTGAGLLNALPVKTVIFESGVECSYSLCGWDNNCPTLEKIVFLSEDPKDCILTKQRYPKNCAVMLQMNDAQINGGCLIYSEYIKLLRPLSQLDAETATYIR